MVFEQKEVCFTLIIPVYVVNAAKVSYCIRANVISSDNVVICFK